jgi:hypothetical protein
MNGVPSSAQKSFLRLSEAASAAVDAPSKTISRALFLIVATGVGLRLAQYLANPALSLDEIAVARNVLERSVWDLLTTPLAYDQTAPKGFLLAEKLMTAVFGSSDYALRLFPLLGSLVALIAFWRVAERILDGAGAPIALALFAAAMPFLAYTAQVKQYSGDVAVSVLLLLLALGLAPHDLSRRRAIWAGAAGAVAVWFSQPSVFVLIGLGVALVVIHRRQSVEPSGRDGTMLAPTLTLWLVAVIAAILVGLASMTPATHDYMRRYWVAGLMPLPVTKAMASFWPWKHLTALFGSGAAAGLGYPAPAAYILIMAIGFCWLWCKRRNAALLMLAPIAVTLAAAMVRQYPFVDRLILFLVPSFILAIAAAIEWMRRSVAPYSPMLMALAVCVAVAPALYGMIKTPPVYQMENIKPVLSHLQAKRSPGDAVYVYYGAGPAVTFYDEEYGLQESDYTLGNCHRGSNRHYLHELDIFRDRKRLWVVMTHAFPPYRERDDILRYLDAIGFRRDSYTAEAQTIGARGLPAEVFLYDLSDPQRLGRAVANSFGLTGPSVINPRMTCSEGPQAMIPTRSLPKSSS